jgi:hypothetical protein
MTGPFEHFDARPGGSYRLIPAYAEASAAREVRRLTEENRLVMSEQPAGDSQLTDDIPLDHNCGLWSQFMR